MLSTERSCVRRGYDLVQLELGDVQEANQQGQKGDKRCFCFAIPLLLCSKIIKKPPKTRSHFLFSSLGGGRLMGGLRLCKKSCVAVIGEKAVF